MPRKYKAKVEKTDKPEQSDNAKLLLRIRDRFKIMSDADDENRRLAMDDLKFVNEIGYQWDWNMKQERGDRPCYEFNKLRINGKRVINDIRANRPQGKVRAVEGGDKKIAELYEGLCRNIWNMSDGDTVVDQAAEYQVDAGMASWRVITEYSDDTAFDQDILIKPIKNPFCLYADPSAQDVLKRDADDWILTERLSKKAYEDKYGDAEKIDFDGAVEFDDEEEWENEETVRVAEYWYKEPYTKEIWLLQGPNGPITVDSSTDEGRALAQIPGYEQQIIRKRLAKCHKVMMCVASGTAILEGPVEWAGSQFPFIMVYGEYKVVDGEVTWCGLHRYAKDAQRSYNVSRTAIDETIASAPKEYFWATPEQAKGNTEKWGEAHRKNYPFKLYNPDAKSPGPPQRVGGADVPIALLQQAEVAAQDIRDVTGLHETSFGEESGEKSGIAIARKQSQAQLVTYNFPDNISKGIKRTWEILIDLIPHIYDAERELRIIGADGAEDYVRVNQIVQDPQTMQAIRVNDLSSGKYDVVITTGPSFSTLRQEAVQVYGEIGSAMPQLWSVAGDLMFKSMDLPYADEIAKRMQTLLPPQIQKQIAEGKDIPPEAQAALAQAEQAMQQVNQVSQMVQQAAQELEKEKALGEKQKAEIDTAIANLKTEEARFEAKVAKAVANLATKEAQAQSGLQDQSMVVEREALSVELKEAITAIQAANAQFMQQTASLLAEMMAKQQTQVIVPPSPKVVSITAKRENGLLTAVPQYEQN